jgi:C4-dicarboxylate transporter DctM subunit
LDATADKKKGLLYYPVKALDGLSYALSTISAILLIVTGVMVVLDIIFRLFGHPILSLVDWVTYLLVIFVFSCFSDGLRHRHHVSTDILVDKLQGRTKLLMEAVQDLIVFVSSSLFAKYFFTWAWDSFKLNEQSGNYVPLPIWPQKIFAAVALVIMALMGLRLFVERLFRLIRNSEGLTFGKGLNNPYILLGGFIILLALGISLMKVSPILGLVLVLIVLLLSGTPIAICIMCASMLAFVVSFSATPGLVEQIPFMAYRYVSKYTLLSLPMFIFAGQVMAKGGLGEDLFGLAKAFIGHIRGGMGIAVVLSCVIFGALSGSASACCVAIGAIAYPTLVSSGYRKEVAAGLIATASGIGVLIPPSNPMVIYGQITGLNIGQLFITGVSPGIIVGVLLIITLIFVCRKDTAIKQRKYTWKERLTALKRSIFALLMPIIVLGGIYGGYFTITEAAAVATVYSVAYSLLARTMNIRQLWGTIRKSVYSVAFIELILIDAQMMQKCITLMRLPDKMMALVQGTPSWVFLIGIMLFCLALGCLIDGAAIMVLVVPVVSSTLTKYGYDLYWFGILMIMLECIGKVTPPVGTSLFIVQKFDDLRSTEIIKGAAPFLAATIAACILIIVFPQLVLWLPSTMS